MLGPYISNACVLGVNWCRFMSSSRRFERTYFLLIPLALPEPEDENSVILRNLREALSEQHEGMSKKTCVYSIIVVGAYNLGSVGISCLKAYILELKVDDKVVVGLEDRTVFVLSVGGTVLVCQVIQLQYWCRL